MYATYISLLSYICICNNNDTSIYYNYSLKSHYICTINGKVIAKKILINQFSSCGPAIHYEHISKSDTLLLISSKYPFNFPFNSSMVSDNSFKFVSCLLWAL